MRVLKWGNDGFYVGVYGSNLPAVSLPRRPNRYCLYRFLLEGSDQRVPDRYIQCFLSYIYELKY